MWGYAWGGVCAEDPGSEDLADAETAHQSEMDSLKEKLKQQLALVDQLRESHATETEQLKEAHRAEMDESLRALTESYAKQIETMMEHHSQALEDHKRIDEAGTKLELELERKKYQSILDDTFEKQGKDLQDVADTYQKLLDAAEADATAARAEAGDRPRVTRVMHSCIRSQRMRHDTCHSCIRSTSMRHATCHSCIGSTLKALTRRVHVNIHVLPIRSVRHQW